MSLLREKSTIIYTSMIYSKKNAGKWVASKKGEVIAVDERLSGVLQKVKGMKKSDIRLDLVPKTSFIIGAHGF